MGWSKHFEKCKSCNTTLFEHKGNGYCTRCYSAIKEITALNQAFGQTLEMFIYKYIPVQEVQKIKAESIEMQKKTLEKCIIYKRLHYLKLYGEIDSDSVDVDILKLENIFNDIALRVTNQGRFYTNKLLYFDTRFSKEQRKIIALRLLLMLINKRKYLLFQ